MQVSRLLNKIKQAESDGLFRSFRPDELAMLLMMSGASEPRITSAFGNQAYVVVAEKQGAASKPIFPTVSFDHVHVGECT